MAPKASASMRITVRRFMMAPLRSRCSDFRPCEAARLSIRSEATAAAGNGFLAGDAQQAVRLRPSANLAADMATGGIHGQVAFDHRLSGACHRPAVDRSGHRRDSLAAIELHDQSTAMGRIWRGAWRHRPYPDLAGQPGN